MKTIPESFRRSYDNLSPLLLEVQSRASFLLKDVASAFNGHYIDRPKSIHSVLSKAEHGKSLSSIKDMEDLFAATIAVPSINQIAEVMGAVQARFNVIDVKAHWKKNPREFVYDDLHMILSLKDDPLIRNKQVLDIRFELQIRTLLQLAWWQLEHDIVYKTRRLSWQKARIFGQIRAMFELADKMLAKIDEVAAIQAEEHYEDYIKINAVAEFLEGIWGIDDPPWYDLRRTAEAILTYLELAELSLGDLANLVAKTENRDLFEAKSLTPTQSIFITLYREKQEMIISNIGSRKILITEEMQDFEPSLKEFPVESRFIL